MMIKMRSVVVAVIAAFVCSMSLSVAMATDKALKVSDASKAKEETVKSSKVPKARNDAARISKASRIVKEIAAIPKKKIPPDLLSGASAIVIVPGAAKLDFMASGKSAGGVMLVHGKDGTWSSPVFVSISGGTLGWQIVSDQMDIVLVFNNRKNVDAVMKGRLILDTRIAIEPGRLGPNMKAATARDLKAEISSYVRTQGAFLEEAVVAGTTVQIDADANAAFYAKSKVEVGDIVSGKVVTSSEDVKALQKLLADYAASR